MQSMTFDYYLLCFKFNQFDLFTKGYIIPAYCIQQCLHKIVNVFYSFDLTCNLLQKEPSYCDGSYEYPQHMFW